MASPRQRSEAALLVAAQTGEEQAFVELTGPHRGALHRHCYRLLGSLFDADDALQETLLRAWRALDRFEPRVPLPAWLHKIATNVCLNMLARRRRDPSAALDSHVVPYPDRLLEAMPAILPGTEAIVEERETIGLAFITAMQLLPAKQRVVLVLRDVLAWTAREVADLLQDTVPAVNSALQRARERLAREQRDGTISRLHAPVDIRTEARLLQRFQEAWAQVDIAGLVALLADDALLTMPPEAMRFEGRDQIATFFATVPLEGRLDLIHLVATRANDQPTLAAYAKDPEAPVFRAYGVMVFAIDGDHITGITGFPRQPALFQALGLPTELAVREAAVDTTRERR